MDIPKIIDIPLKFELEEATIKCVPLNQIIMVFIT
jgi:hypothetical protein